MISYVNYDKGTFVVLVCSMGMKCMLQIPSVSIVSSK